MFSTTKFRLSLVLGAALLFTAPAVMAERGGRHRDDGRSYASRSNGYRSNGHQGYGAPARRYVAPPRVYVGGGGFTAGRFYGGRGYFYGGRFWARPYFGIGIGIPFGYGYRTARGCGYVDHRGVFYPAPCY